jgi:microcystin-dependent protein
LLDVPASKLSGTIADARLSANVALTNNANIQFSGRVKDKTGFIMPVGTILPYGGTTAPDGWVLCDGTTKLRSGTYGDLFQAIGTAYGPGDGSLTFNVPNLQGRVPVGKSSETDFNALGKTGGEKTHTLTVAEMPSHNHYLVSDNTYVTLLGNDSGDLFDTGASGGSIKKDNQYSTPTTQNTGGGGSHNNLQPYITLNYIIKY